jgi:hypothetical protein
VVGNGKNGEGKWGGRARRQRQGQKWNVAVRTEGTTDARGWERTHGRAGKRSTKFLSRFHTF